MFVGWKRSDTGKIWGILLQTAFRRNASDKKKHNYDIFLEEFLAGFGIPIFFMDNDIHSKIWNKDHSDTVSMISWPATNNLFLTKKTRIIFVTKKTWIIFVTKKTRIIFHPTIPLGSHWDPMGFSTDPQGLPRLRRAFLRDPSLVGCRWGRRRRTGTAGTLGADPNGRGGPLGRKKGRGRQKKRWFFGGIWSIYPLVNIEKAIENGWTWPSYSWFTY